MATRPARPQNRSTKSGIAFDVLEPGSFYQGVMPGNCSDALTGITIPGPKAILDDKDSRRNIIGLTELPEPVQLPHYKLVLEISDDGKTKKEALVDFNAADRQPTHEYFQLALATGQIRHVSDEEMAEKYPETWAARSEELVYRTGEVKNEKSMREMLDEASEKDDFERLVKTAQNAKMVKVDQAAREAEIDAPAQKTTPARPARPARP